eukprot:147697_1
MLHRNTATPNVPLRAAMHPLRASPKHKPHSTSWLPFLLYSFIIVPPYMAPHSFIRSNVFPMCLSSKKDQLHHQIPFLVMPTLKIRLMNSLSHKCISLFRGSAERCGNE